MAMQNCNLQEARAHIERWFSMPGANSASQHERRRSAMSGERPSHKCFVVDGDGDSAFWTRVGSAWPHKDGKGLNLQLASGVAVSGRVVLREFTEDDAKKEEEEKSTSKYKKK
jgi:hypothetical protein